MTLPGDLLPLASRKCKNRCALVSSGDEWSYGQLERIVDGVACRLRDHGLREESRIATYLPATADHVILIAAIMRLGGIAVPLDSRLPGKTARGLMNQIKASAVVSPVEQEAAGSGIRLAPDDLLRAAAASVGSFEPAELRPERDATIVFTSGTTSQPKAVLHSYAAHCYSALGSNANIRIEPDDCWLLTLPLNHVAGLGILFRCWLAGATVAIPDEPGEICEKVGSKTITHLSAVPTQLRRLLRDTPTLGLKSRLKAVLVGGEATDPALIEEAFEAGLPIHMTYGLTETASQVTTTAPGAALEELQTSGRVLEHRELKLTESGEICLRGSCLLKGYVEGDTVVEPFDHDGWFATGDTGRVDGYGRLIVTGRHDNMFISGGENVYPEEIEAALLRVKGVMEAVVVPVPDIEFGQRPVAFIRGEIDPEGNKLAAALASVLPRFKLPVAFYPWPKERGGGGIKPSRADLKDLAKKLYARQD
jgi:O-succinylbenzoic acid--CoA ligase